jgi:multimeric flavodoxin WrbA
MNVCVVNGSPETGPLDRYLVTLRRELESRGATAQELVLRDMEIRYCTGCWGCWVKTPGECVARDDSDRVCQAVVNSDLVLWASPVVMGFVSSLLKKTCDKLIPILHPYFAIVNGEMHHAPRYARYPEFGLILDVEGKAVTEEDTKLIFDIYGRTALNMKSGLSIAITTDTPIKEVADEISSRKRVA